MSLIAALALAGAMVTFAGTERSVCIQRTCAATEPAAQRERRAREETLLDKVGLGSLRDIPWATLPAALALSALIGAAGGFVYSGIVGEGRSSEEPRHEGSDRPSS